MALGVVVTALVQSVLTGIALWICGIPSPAVFAALVFMLGIAQLGPVAHHDSRHRVAVLDQ